MRQTDFTPQDHRRGNQDSSIAGPRPAGISLRSLRTQQLGLRVERQKAVPLIYENVKLECGFRADLVIDSSVVVETKCKDALHPIDEAQLLSHLRLLNIPIGLLINFHVMVLKDGIRRTVNNYREPVELVV